MQEPQALARLNVPPIIPDRACYFQQFRDLSAWIGSVEDGRAGHQHLGSRLDDLRSRFGVDPAVNLDHTPVVAFVDHPSGLSNLFKRIRNELLASKAGIDRHDQQHIRQTEHVLDRTDRSRRIQ